MVKYMLRIVAISGDMNVGSMKATTRSSTKAFPTNMQAPYSGTSVSPSESRMSLKAVGMMVISHPPQIISPTLQGVIILLCLKGDLMVITLSTGINTNEKMFTRNRSCTSFYAFQLTILSTPTAEETIIVPDMKHFAVAMIIPYINRLATNMLCGLCKLLVVLMV